MRCTAPAGLLARSEFATACCASDKAAVSVGLARSLASTSGGITRSVANWSGYLASSSWQEAPPDGALLEVAGGAVGGEELESLLEPPQPAASRAAHSGSRATRRRGRASTRSFSSIEPG